MPKMGSKTREIKRTNGLALDDLAVLNRAKEIKFFEQNIGMIQRSIG